MAAMNAHSHKCKRCGRLTDCTRRKIDCDALTKSELCSACTDPPTMAEMTLADVTEQLQNAKDYIAQSDSVCQQTLKDLGLTWQHLGVPTTVDRLAREIKKLRAASYRSHTYEDAR